MPKILSWTWMAVAVAALLMMTPTVLSQDASDEDVMLTIAVVWSNDGKKIAAVGSRAGTDDGYIFVFDAATEEIIYRLETPYGGFASVVWSPDDRYIAVGGHDQTLKVIDVEPGEIVATLSGHRWVVSSVDWSADGTRLVTSSSGDQQVILWNATTYEVIRQIEIGDPWAVAFSPDDQYITVGSASGLWVLPNDLVLVGGKLIDQYHQANGNLSAVAWSHDGTRIAFGNRTFQPTTGTRPNPQVTIIDGTNNAIITSFEVPNGETVYGLAWSPDDALIATYSLDGTVGIWDSATGDGIQSFSGQAGYIIKSVAFSPYGGRLAYGQSFDPDSEEAPFQIVVPAPSLDRLAAIATLCVRDGDARAESLTDRAPTALDDLPAFVAQVEALPDGSIPPACRADLLAVASALSSQDASDEMPFVEWSPNGKLIAYWNERDFRLVDVETGKTHALSSLSGVVNTLDWSPDGDRMVIGTSEGEVQIWQVNILSTNAVITEKLTVLSHGMVRDIDGVEAGVSDVVWSPDGNLIASSSGVGGDSLQVWDAQTYTKRFTAQASSVAGMAWNETGTELAVASVNGLRILNGLHFTSSTPVVWSYEVWQAQTNNLGREIPEQRLSNPIWDASNRTIVVTTWFGEMWLVDTANGSVKQLAVLDQTQALGQSHRYLDVIFDPLTSEYIGLIRYSYPNDIYHQIMGLNNYSNQVDLVLPDLPHNITLSPYGGQLAYGQSFDPDFEEAPFQIVVPAPSLDRLAAITALCVRDGDARAESLTDSVPTALDDLPAFVAQVEALPEGAIPPACKADVLAVASALSPSTSSQDSSDEDVMHITTVAWSPNGDKIATATNTGHLYLWDVATDALLYEIQAHEGVIYIISWSPDSTRFATASPEDKVQRIWEADTGELITLLPGHVFYEGPAFIDWNPNGTLLASVASVIDGSGPLQFWRVEGDDIQELPIIYEVAAYDVGWNPDGTKLAIADLGGILIFDDFSETILERFIAPFHFLFAWSPDGTKLVAAEAQTGVVNVIDVDTGQTFLSVQDPTERIASVAWSPDGTTIIADHFGGIVQIWDALTGEPLQTLSSDRQGGRFLMSLSPYGGRLVLGNSAAELTGSHDDRGFQIVVPAPSFDRLTAIIALCVRGGDARAESLIDSASTALDDLPAFVAQVEALPDGAIPPACKADLLAVASALEE